MADHKFGNLHLKNGKEVSDYAAKIVADTEELIINKIPDKIFSLDKMNKEKFLIYSDLTSVSTELNISESIHKHILYDGAVSDHHTISSKKRKLDGEKESIGNGSLHNLDVIPCNKKLLHLIDLIKPEVRDMIETCEKIQMWIQLLIPRIEDGNNFGVSIQEEVLNEVNRIQSESVNYLDAISRYFITRAKIVSKLAKYPFLEDYRRAVKEVDEKEYMSLQFSINEIRSHYMLILDVVSKNYEKLKKPRSAQNHSMY